MITLLSQHGYHSYIIVHSSTFYFYFYFYYFWFESFDFFISLNFHIISFKYKQSYFLLSTFLSNLFALSLLSTKKFSPYNVYFRDFLQELEKQTSESTSGNCSFKFKYKNCKPYASSKSRSFNLFFSKASSKSPKFLYKFPLLSMKGIYTTFLIIYGRSLSVFFYASLNLLRLFCDF